MNRLRRWWNRLSFVRPYSVREHVVSMCNYRDGLIVVTSEGKVLLLEADQHLGRGFRVSVLQELPLN